MPASAASHIIDLESEDDGSDPTVSSIRDMMEPRRRRWRPTLRRDQATTEPVLLLNPGDKRSRGESPSPNTERDKFEKVNIPL